MGEKLILELADGTGLKAQNGELGNFGLAPAAIRNAQGYSCN